MRAIAQRLILCALLFGFVAPSSQALAGGGVFWEMARSQSDDDSESTENDRQGDTIRDRDDRPTIHIELLEMILRLFN